MQFVIVACMLRMIITWLLVKESWRNLLLLIIMFIIEINCVIIVLGIGAIV